MFVKVCGITRVADAREAVARGATALGFVFWSASPRCIDPDQAATIIEEISGQVESVGVFVNQAVDEIVRVAERTGLSMVQLHGDEPSGYATRLRWPLLKATTLAAADETFADWPEPALVLLDAHDPVRRGGTGARIDWDKAAKLAARRRVVLAGGLTPDNVHEAIVTVRPHGVDVSSGVEESPGVKNPDKLARFLEQVRSVTDGR